MNEVKEQQERIAKHFSAALVQLFERPDPKSTVMSGKFHAMYARPLALDCVVLAAAWGSTFEHKYSDVSHAMITVANQAVSTLKDWGEAVMLCMFEGSQRHEMEQVRSVPKLTAGRVKACGHSLQFCRELLLYDFGMQQQIKDTLEKRKWTNRPQGKLLAAISAQYLEFLALYMHASCSIGAFDSHSPYWKFVNKDRSTLILRDNSETLNDQYAVGFVGYPREEFRWMAALRDAARAIVNYK